MKNPFNSVGSQAVRGSGQQSPRKVPLRLAAAGVGVVLLLVVLVVSSLDSSPGDPPTPAAKDGTDGNQPWWAADNPSEVPSPSSSTPPSDTYLIVGPETASPSTSPTPGRPPGTSPGRPRSSPVKPPPRAPVVTFSGIAGDGCRHDSTRGYQEIGRYSDGSRGWYSRSSGGWTGDGCSGTFDALPMSGYATRDDTSAFVVWWFKPANLRQGSCTISVYIPTGREFEDVAGDPAYYNVVAGQGNYDRVSGFRIDQIQNRGRWLTAGTFPLRDGQIAVQMVTRGQDPNGEHLAAGQVRASCAAQV
jgi:hypothetical protein